MVPYRLMYRLGFAPWERRNVPELWRPLFEGPDAMEPARALDIGCGSGRDAVHLAGRGWQVSGRGVRRQARLRRARQRAAEEGVEVQWVKGDVGELGRLGLEPGYDLLYDFGCIQGLPDAARQGAAAGIDRARLAGRQVASARLQGGAAHGATARDGYDARPRPAGRRLGGSNVAESAVIEDMPPPVRRAEPTLYRLVRRSRVPE